MLYNIKISTTREGDEANYESHVVSEVAKSLEDAKIITASKIGSIHINASERLAAKAFVRVYEHNMRLHERLRASFTDIFASAFNSVFNQNRDDDKELLRDAYKQTITKTITKDR